MSEQALPEMVARKPADVCIRVGCHNRTTQPYCPMCDAMRRELSGAK